MNEERKMVEFYFTCGRKTGSRNAGSWSPSKSATKPVKEADSPLGEWNSLNSSWLILEEKILHTFLFAVTVLSLVFHQAC